MKLLVQLMDDNGEVLVKHEADPSQPSQWRAQPGQKFVSKMPQQSDKENNGTYELCGFTFQPHVRIDRPNGWSAPAPSTGLPVNFPTQGFGAVKTSYPAPLKQYPWSTSAPTQAPQTSILQGPRG